MADGAAGVSSESEEVPSRVLPMMCGGPGKKEEGTAPAEWIQGLLSNRLNAFGISSTWNVMLNEHGPTSMRRSISPFTSLREPSKARTAVLLGRTRLRSTFICFKTMCNARECVQPSDGSSSSENEMVLEKMKPTVSSILSGGVSLGTCAAVSTRRRASR
ncbi:hypothetical protein CRG98_028337 [Punica granatum]|uniref:Uncharacterized protein n=1 Tax=Punica granatum TaxID=22663 RepID=A0A2I0J5D7_PUNGR|nr:hypothetical protein CRG98_028337 [Punica granatum]